MCQHHARKAEDAERVAELEARRSPEAEGRHLRGLHLQEREIAPRHAAACDRRAVLGDLGGEAEAVGGEDEDRRLQIDLGAGEQLGDRRQVAERAGLPDALLRQLAGDPAGQLVGGLHDVAVGDDPAVPIHEPARAGLTKRRGRDRLHAVAAVHADVGGDLRDDEHGGRLRAEDHLLR